MILPIYVYGQPVLRKEAEDITPDYPNLKELIANMFETMNRADGVGLAAPQIGLPIRVVTIDLDVMSDDLPEFKDFRRAYINPHILEVDVELHHFVGIAFACIFDCNRGFHVSFSAHNRVAELHVAIFKIGIG